jgi:hypothetical protein
MRLPYNGNADFAAAGWKLLFVFTRSFQKAAFTRLPPCVNLYGFDASL